VDLIERTGHYSGSLFKLSTLFADPLCKWMSGEF
jgi:hypothetical protein